jgi:ABC-type polysaccharide/polyol phosphate transport system ATPase subunit
MERIHLDKISKKFTVDSKDKRALEGIVAFFNNRVKRESKKKIQALKDITFKAQTGENIGILGRNGSGKSTLLRIIAGIYTADSGSVKTSGKIIYLDGLAQGLMHRLTMKENIHLMGSLLGLNQKDIKSKFNTIVEFSGLEEFINMKIFQFSAGMITRFSFSATIHFVEHCNPDILLFDEVFNAGADINFQKKALQKMESLIKGGATVLLISHDLQIIRNYCHRAIWINNGQILKDGPPQEVCEAYEKN